MGLNQFIDFLSFEDKEFYGDAYETERVSFVEVIGNSHGVTPNS